jgi:hypothetical protein
VGESIVLKDHDEGIEKSRGFGQRALEARTGI